MHYLQVFNNGSFPPRFSKYFLAQKLIAPGGAVYCLQWSLDGKYLAAATAQGTIVVWAVVVSRAERAQVDPEGAHVFQPTPVATFAHGATVNSIDWSPNGFLLSSSEDLTVKLWHVDRVDCLHTYRFGGIVTAAKFLKSDDRFFVATLWNGHVYFLSILSKSIVFEKELDIQITSFDVTVTLNDNTHVILGGDKGMVYVLDLMKSFEVLASYQIKDKSHNLPTVTGIECFYDNHSPATLVAKHQRVPGRMDVKLLITTNDSRVRLINYSSKCLEVRYSGAEVKTSSIMAHINDNRNYILSGSEDGWVYVWDTYYGFKRWAGHLKFPDTKETKKSKLLKPFANVVIPGLPFGEDVAQVRNKHYASWHVFQKTNVAVWGPRATSKLLELSDDPIWELYNTGRHVERLSQGLTGEDLEDPVLDELFGSALIVAADSNGTIKVLRLDFAHEYRKMLEKRAKQRTKKPPPTGSNGGSSSTGGDESSVGAQALERTKTLLTVGMVGRARAGSLVTNSTLETQDGDASFGGSAPSAPSALSGGSTDDDPRAAFAMGSEDTSSSTLHTLGKLGPDEQLRQRRRMQLDAATRRTQDTPPTSATEGTEGTATANGSQSSGITAANTAANTAALRSRTDSKKNPHVLDGDVDKELRRLMKLHTVDERANETDDSKEPVEAAGETKCSRCDSSEFTAIPFTHGDTNRITFRCKNCGEVHQ